MKKFTGKILTILSVSVFGVIFLTQGVLGFGGGSGYDISLWQMVGGVVKPSTANQAVEIYDLEVTNLFTLSGTVASGGIDLNGEKLILDADADTSIQADTDDQIDFEIGGSDLIVFESDGAIKMANDIWLKADNNAGTSTISMFKINTSDEIDVGATLNAGSFTFSEDSGIVTALDMAVSATPATSTVESYTFKIDGDSIFTIYAEADSLGGIQNSRVGIGTTTPATLLHMVGDGTSGTGYARFGLSTTEYTEIGHKGVNSSINAVGDGGLDFRHDGNTKMTILDSGYVGIATTTPAYELDVEGSIHGNDYYSQDGTIGWTGTCSSASSTVVKDGLVVGCE